MKSRKSPRNYTAATPRKRSRLTHKGTKNNDKTIKAKCDDNTKQAEEDYRETSTKERKRKKLPEKEDSSRMVEIKKKKRRCRGIVEDEEYAGDDSVEEVEENGKTGSYNGQYRCTFDPIVTIASEIRKKLSKANMKDFNLPQQPFENLLLAIVELENFDKSECPNSAKGNMKDSTLPKHPFENLLRAIFELENFDKSAYPKSQRVIRSIVEAYSPEEGAFKIGTRMVKLTPEDIALMLGMPLSGKMVNVFSKDPVTSDLFERFFSDQKFITKIAIMDKVRELSERENMMDTDMTKMLILLVACTLLFPNSTMIIGKSFLKLIDSIKTLNEISWPKVIHEDMVKKLVKHKECPEKMPCCVYILMCWLCEHTKLVARIPGRENMPRIFQWSYKAIIKEVEKVQLSAISNEKVIEEITELHEHEKSLLHFSPQKESPSSNAFLKENAELKDQVKKQSESIKELEKKNAALEEQHKKSEWIIEYLNDQIDKLKDANRKKGA